MVVSHIQANPCCVHLQLLSTVILGRTCERQTILEYSKCSCVVTYLVSVVYLGLSYFPLAYLTGFVPNSNPIYHVQTRFFTHII